LAVIATISKGYDLDYIWKHVDRGPTKDAASYYIQASARRTGTSVTFAVWRMHGGVRPPGTVGPGRDEYDSGLRDRCR
jgi:hypothetical protein